LTEGEGYQSINQVLFQTETSIRSK